MIRLKVSLDSSRPVSTLNSLLRVISCEFFYPGFVWHRIFYQFFPVNSSPDNSYSGQFFPEQFFPVVREKLLMEELFGEELSEEKMQL
jgi:hypothetical protein